MLSGFQDLLQSLCLWAARGRMLFGFRTSSGVPMFNPFRFNGDGPFPRSIFSDLGRSQQQGKSNDLNETEDSAVLTVEGSSPRGLARDGCTQVWAGGPGAWCSCSAHAAAGLAQEGIFRMVQRKEVKWGEARRRWAGSMAGPCHRVDSRDESRMSS